MKIGFLIRYFQPGMGGAENNCYYLARELAKDRKNQVHIFCSAQEEQKLEETISNIKIHRARIILNFSYYFSLYPSITRKIAKENLDILHVHGFGFIQNDISVRNLRKKNPSLKLVCTPHGPFMALGRYNIFSRLCKKLYTYIIIKNLRDYDVIIEVNPFQKSWMKKDYNISRSKIRFLPNGISEESLIKIPNTRIEATKKKFSLKDKFVISYLGRIQEYKGIEQIINILPELIKIKNNLVFLAIGKDAGDTERLKIISERLKVKSKVVFTGEVSEEDKLALLDISEIFIFPSQWEAFGIVVLEAMARKNAIISTKTEGGKYLIKPKENGFLFNFGDERELLKNIKTLILNEKLRGEIREINLKKSKRFLWTRIAKELKTIYSNI